ncbi:MAG: hypothetical protein AAFY57_04515 [Cyanobacteria bacterium J06642_2]
MGSNAVLTELLRNPLPFCGGFIAGLLRLNLNEDPLKSWLEQQGISTDSMGGTPSSESDRGPQNISID